MKAVLCKEYGPPEKLVYEDTTRPDVGPTDVRIRVRAAGVNFPDLLIIENKYQFKPPLPFAPGGEVAGDVIEVGAEVTDFSRGDRVIGMCGWNGFAEEVVISRDRVVRMPDGMPYEVGTVLPTTYGTTVHALVQRGRLRAGEWLLVHGATGGAAVGVFSGGFAAREPETNRRNFALLFDWWKEGKLKPAISHRFPLAKAAEALGALARREVVGKAVLEVG